MADIAPADSFLVDRILISHEGRQYERISGIDEEGPFIELWLRQDKEPEDREPEDRETRTLYSYWLNNQSVLTLQKHHTDSSPALDAVFVDEAEKLLPVLNQKFNQLPSPARWLYQKPD